MMLQSTKKSRYKVIEQFFSEEELLNGALKDFDAVIVEAQQRLTSQW